MDFTGKEWHMFRLVAHHMRGQTVRFDLDGVDVHAWSSVNPVYCDASMSGESSTTQPKSVQAQPADRGYNGPELPPHASRTWKFIPTVWVSGPSTISFIHTFKQDDIDIAMDVPYSSADLQRLIANMAHSPDVQVIQAGQSREGRPLQIIQVGSSTTLPTVVFYAREHPDEQDCSWVVDGATRFITSGTDSANSIRKSAVFLFIPILDPDGAAMNQHYGMINTFDPDNESKESGCYAAFFKKWVDSGHRLDLVLDVHSGPTLAHLCLPEITTVEGKDQFGLDLIDRYVSRARDLGLVVVDRPWGADTTTHRLHSWLNYAYGPQTIALETNGQESHRHLDVAQIRELGRIIVEESVQYFATARGKLLLDEVHQRREQRLAQWREFGSPLGRHDAIWEERTVQWRAQSAAILQKMKESNTR